MKLTGLIFLSILSLGFTELNAQPADSQDHIVGEWLNEEKDGKVTIFKEGDRYFGKISWLEDPKDEQGRNRTDENNPSESLRSKPLIGLVILKDFKFDGSQWRGGDIYDPKNGKTYNCYMELLEPNKLKIRGYIGKSWMGLGRTTYWTR